MQLFWTKSSSTVKPSDVDYTSSPTTVYLHRNVTERTTSDGVKFYDYEECKLTPEDFKTYVSATYTDITNGVDELGNTMSSTVEAVDGLGETISSLEERISTLESKENSLSN